MTLPDVRWVVGGEMISLTIPMLEHRRPKDPSELTLEENRLWWARHTTIDAHTEQSDTIR